MDLRMRVDEALRTGEGLPAAPGVIGRITEVCRDPDSTARDLGKVIQFDTALTTRVLKLVNSSFYGLSATIQTVTHAVVILGFQEIKNVVYSVPVADLYQNSTGKPGIDIRQLWETSVETACLARALSYHIKHPVPEQVFVLGILSNAGMVVLNNLLGEDYARVVESCADEDFLPDIEAAEIGISHAEVGRLLAVKWRFPEELVQSIASHHDPLAEDGTFLQDTGLLYVGQQLRRALAAGTSMDDTLPGIPTPLVDTFALTAEVLTEVTTRAERDFEEAKRMLAK